MPKPRRILDQNHSIADPRLPKAPRTFISILTMPVSNSIGKFIYFLAFLLLIALFFVITALYPAIKESPDRSREKNYQRQIEKERQENYDKNIRPYVR